MSDTDFSWEEVFKEEDLKNFHVTHRDAVTLAPIDWLDGTPELVKELNTRLSEILRERGRVVHKMASSDWFDSSGFSEKELNGCTHQAILVAEKKL